MNKLLLTLGTALLIFGCAKESNIYLNCEQINGSMYFELTIDTSKKEFIFYGWSHTDGIIKTRYERPVSYTKYDDKLISEKYEKPDVVGSFGSYSAYEILTFNKINGNLEVELFEDGYTPLSSTYSCTVIERFME